MDSNSEVWKSLPERWRSGLGRELAEGETLIGWFETDLNQQLQYSAELVALTDRRLLSYGAAADAEHVAAVKSIAPQSAGSNSSESNGSVSNWQGWPLAADLELRSSEHFGLGILELQNSASRLAHWRYTAACSPSARRFESRWQALRARISESKNGAPQLNTVCPSCGEVISGNDGVCASCATWPRRHRFHRYSGC